MNATEKMINEAIRTFYGDMPSDIKSLSDQASYDLWHGPICEDDNYPGFDAACDILRAWDDDNVTDLYVEEWSGYVSRQEPEPYEDEEGIWCEPDGYYIVDARMVRGILFGRELSEYI